MKMDHGKELPQRKRLRLKNFDYSTPEAYFITICTHNRKCTLSRVVGAIHESPEIELTDYGKIIDETIRNIPERYKATGRSVISKVIGYVKMNASKEIHGKYDDAVIWQRIFSLPICAIMVLTKSLPCVKGGGSRRLTEGL